MCLLFSFQWRKKGGKGRNPFLTGCEHESPKEKTNRFVGFELFVFVSGDNVVYGNLWRLQDLCAIPV